VRAGTGTPDPRDGVGPRSRPSVGRAHHSTPRRPSAASRDRGSVPGRRGRRSVGPCPRGTAAGESSTRVGATCPAAHRTTPRRVRWPPGFSARLSGGGISRGAGGRSSPPAGRWGPGPPGSDPAPAPRSSTVGSVTMPGPEATTPGGRPGRRGGSGALPDRARSVTPGRSAAPSGCSPGRGPGPRRRGPPPAAWPSAPGAGRRPSRRT
jgi:hypothetical protein